MAVVSTLQAGAHGVERRLAPVEKLEAERALSE